MAEIDQEYSLPDPIAEAIADVEAAWSALGEFEGNDIRQEEAEAATARLYDLIHLALIAGNENTPGRSPTTFPALGGKGPTDHDPEYGKG